MTLPELFGQRAAEADQRARDAQLAFHLPKRSRDELRACADAEARTWRAAARMAREAPSLEER